MDVILRFWVEDLGRFGMFSLVLVILEKLLDYNFVCPCSFGYNIVSCLFYALVPAVSCFISTCCFVDVMPELNNNQEDKCCNMSRRFCYSISTVFTWFCIILIDGRYLACACSIWEGVYTNSAFGKWCKPTGNETLQIEKQQETQKWMFISQCLGLVLTLLNISLLIGIKNYMERTLPETSSNDIALQNTILPCRITLTLTPLEEKPVVQNRPSHNDTEN